MRNQLKRTPAGAIKSLVAMMMVLCLIMGMIPMAFAAESAGTTPGDLEPSETKVYIKLSNPVSFFTGALYGEGTVVTPAVGGVYQLISDDWYTGSDAQEYYGVYYQNTGYNVRKSDVAADIMTPAELETYITETLWEQTTYPTLRKSMELIGDVRVHGLQLALQKLGYYHGELDGAYGKQTHDAVAKFQRQKGLDADGSAGPLTQPVLYALAKGTATEGGSSSSGSTGSATAPTTGTLRTIASVNLRKYGNIKSARLGQIPKNVNLSFTDTYKNSAGITWYQVRYAGETGWVMGTYVTVTSGGSSSGSTGSISSIGTLRTNVEVNLRKYASK
ncbi:MAG: peptidoglycan-binding protein, partial [Clostridia bacterium]|nr:peptidoglycan-binding protein [Clostridia bacterium]